VKSLVVAGSWKLSAGAPLKGYSWG
jgi:hypothetical protein